MPPAPTLIAIAAASTAIAAATAAAPAGAVISPRTCGTLTHKEQRYVIRAHTISCSKAKRYARDYLVRRRKPAGWRCRRFSAETSKLAFRCTRSKAELFAIRK